MATEKTTTYIKYNEFDVDNMKILILMVNGMFQG